MHLNVSVHTLRAHFRLNPRLTKVFSPVNLKHELLRYAYLVPWYSYGSLLSIHTKKSTNIP